MTKRYRTRVAVDRVDMQVRSGEVYGFLGPNGAGKTTTLRMLAGLVAPRTGSAMVLDADPGDPAVLRRIGVLIEGPGFCPYLSGRDNLTVLARYRGLDRAAPDEALARVGLAESTVAEMRGEASLLVRAAPAGPALAAVCEVAAGRVEVTAAGIR